MRQNMRCKDKNISLDMNVGFYLLSNAYESKRKAQSENMDFLGQERERERAKNNCHQLADW